MTSTLAHGTWWDLKKQRSRRRTDGRPLHPALPAREGRGLQRRCTHRARTCDDISRVRTRPHPRPRSTRRRTRASPPPTRTSDSSSTTTSPSTPPRSSASPITTCRRTNCRRLVDFRTPRFDLDNVYGRGPADQPYLYAVRRTAPRTRRAHSPAIRTTRTPSTSPAHRTAARSSAILATTRTGSSRSSNRSCCDSTTVSSPKPPQPNFDDVRAQVRMALPVGRRQRLPPHDHQRGDDSQHLPAPREQHEHRSDTDHNSRSLRCSPASTSCPSSSPSPPTDSVTP